MTKELEKILNTMQVIKGYCDERNGCEGCPFFIIDSNLVYGDVKTYCQIRELGKQLASAPCSWDMESIEDIAVR